MLLSCLVNCWLCFFFFDDNFFTRFTIVSCSKDCLFFHTFFAYFTTISKIRWRNKPPSLWNHLGPPHDHWTPLSFVLLHTINFSMMILLYLFQKKNKYKPDLKKLLLSSIYSNNSSRYQGILFVRLGFRTKN